MPHVSAVSGFSARAIADHSKRESPRRPRCRRLFLADAPVPQRPLPPSTSSGDSTAFPGPFRRYVNDDEGDRSSHTFQSQACVREHAMRAHCCMTRRARAICSLGDAALGRW